MTLVDLNDSHPCVFRADQGEWLLVACTVPVPGRTSSPVGIAFLCDYRAEPIKDSMRYCLDSIGTVYPACMAMMSHPQDVPELVMRRVRQYGVPFRLLRKAG